MFTKKPPVQSPVTKRPSMGRAVLVKGTGLLIDEDALLGGQDAGAQSEAIEGRLANLAEIVGGLAEVLVVLLVKELVVARDGGEEVFHI